MTYRIQPADFAPGAQPATSCKRALTMLGMTIGVATVLTMISVGSGAETAIEDQVQARPA